MSSSNGTTDVVVLGGGPGGYAAAFRAADLGQDVTLIDLDENPGGTCLYRGCIPSKALLHVADILTEAREADSWGITFEKPKIDVKKLSQATADVVAKMTGGLGQLCKSRKVNFVQGRGSFLDEHTVRVHHVGGGEEDIRFEHAVVATGSRPAVAPSLDLETPRVMNSTDALKLETVPKTLLVIGGGYIGLELGTVYAALGSKVTVVEMTDSLLPGADKDLVRPLAKRLEEKLHAIHLNTQVTSMETAKNGIKVSLDGPDIEKKPHTFDRVLVCVGRTPNSSGVGLQNTKAVIDDHGFVEVDGQLRTGSPSIFAIGDLVGQPMLAHKATHEGRVAADVIAGHDVVNDVRAIPAVVFTDPEVAWVGLTETEAKRQERDVEVARFPWGALGRATTLHRNDGLTKLICDPETKAVLGVGIVGKNAGDLIAEGTLAIEMGALAQDLELTVHPHPTLSESLMEAAELIYGSSTHLYRPKKKEKAEA